MKSWDSTKTTGSVVKTNRLSITCTRNYNNLVLFSFTHKAFVSRLVLNTCRIGLILLFLRWINKTKKVLIKKRKKRNLKSLSCPLHMKEGAGIWACTHFHLLKVNIHVSDSVKRVPRPDPWTFPWQTKQITMCSSRKYLIYSLSSPRKDWHFPGVWGICKIKNLKCKKVN